MFYLVVYSNEPVADQYLVKTSPMSLRPVLANISDMYTLFGQLTHGVRNGKGKLICSHVGLS